MSNSQDDAIPEDVYQKMGVRHLIECNCILPQFLEMEEPIFHKFPVFSIVDENNEVEEKVVACNNCSTLHTVHEIFRSKVEKSENAHMLRKKEDIAVSLPNHIKQILEDHDCDISVWEEVEFNLDEEMWGAEIILTRENIEEKVVGKSLELKNANRVKINSYSRQNYIKI